MPSKFAMKSNVRYDEKIHYDITGEMHDIE